MSAKANAQPGRRAPLSLSGTGGGAGGHAKQTQLQFQKQQASSNGNNSNGRPEKIATHKTEIHGNIPMKEQQGPPKDNNNKKQQQHQHQQQAERSDEKKSQVGNSRGNSNNNKDKPNRKDETKEKEREKDKEKEADKKIERESRVKRTEVEVAEKKKPEPSLPAVPLVEEKPAAVTEQLSVAAVVPAEKVTSTTPSKGVNPEKKVVAPKAATAKPAPVTPTTTTAEEPNSTAAKEDTVGTVTPANAVGEQIGAAPKPEPIIVATPANQTAVEKEACVEKITTSTSSTTTTTTTTVITEVDDVEMEVLSVESSSPVKATKPAEVGLLPAATSTPGKVVGGSKRNTAVNPKSEVQLAMDCSSSPDRNNCARSYSQISGRRSIRPANEYTPSHFQSNPQFRESYRRIKTDLDITSTTNTSLNVTVGSEVPNNSSFSFFGRGRKRDRTPPNSKSAIELQTDCLTSPPKRARLDLPGFFSAVASPLSLLRMRFSKTSLKSSTPMKLRAKLAAEEVQGVHNVSGISIEEEIPNGAADPDADTADEDITVGAEAGKQVELTAVDNVQESQMKEKCDGIAEKETSIVADGADGADGGDGDGNAGDNDDNANGNDNTDDDNCDDIKIKETKNKRCSIM